MIVIVAELVSIIECHYASNLGGTLSSWGLLGSGAGGDTPVLSKLRSEDSERKRDYDRRINTSGFCKG